jgi:hypothetical protein
MNRIDFVGFAPTDAQREAITWLRRHNGDGLFDRDGVLLAAGERAPFMRSTWNALAELGLVEFYNPTGKGRGRLRLTAKACDVPDVGQRVLDARQACMSPHPMDDGYGDEGAAVISASQQHAVDAQDAGQVVPERFDIRVLAAAHPGETRANDGPGKAVRPAAIQRNIGVGRRADRPRQAMSSGNGNLFCKRRVHDHRQRRQGMAPFESVGRRSMEAFAGRCNTEVAA